MDHEQARQRFYDLVWPQMPVVLRVAQILSGGDVPESEDLAQETMLKAFGALDSFRPGTDVKAWLLAILRNARVDRVRAAAAKPTLSLNQLDVEPASRPEDNQLDRAAVEENPEAVLASFSDQQVIKALARLPEEIRWTLLLVDIEGMAHPEAAELLDVPVGTIKSRAHRGRAMLREWLLPLARRARIVGETAAAPRTETERLGEPDGHA